jgi:hypothetical protein
MKTPVVLLLALVLGGLLVASFFAAVHLWRDIGVDIGLFGWLVVAGGGLLTILLGAGLMALVFLSARRGYDDRVQNHMED